jgi:hypothetical protein
MGFEPTTFGTTIRRSNQLNYIHHLFSSVITRTTSKLPLPAEALAQEGNQLNYIHHVSINIYLPKSLNTRLPKHALALKLQHRLIAKADI